MISIFIAIICFAIVIPIKIYETSLQLLLQKQGVSSFGVSSKFINLKNRLYNNSNTQTTKQNKTKKILLKIQLLLVKSLKMIVFFLQAIASILASLGVFGVLILIVVVGAIVAAVGGCIVVTNGANGSSNSITSGIAGGSAISGGNYGFSGGYTSIEIPPEAGGMSIPLYLQYDSKWKEIPFGGGNIGSSGCGATSMAMIVTYLTGQQVTPDMVVAKIGNKYYSPPDGQSWDMPAGVADAFGLKHVYVKKTVSAEKIIEYLKQGLPVLVSTSGYGTTKEFTNHGHYIVLRGLDSNGKVLVNDPNDNLDKKKHYLKAYDADFIVSECTANGTKKCMWVFSK